MSTGVSLTAFGMKCLMLLPLMTTRIHGYDMWHAVDPMLVVCDPIPIPNPLPPGINTPEEWPAEQEFDVMIQNKFDMDESKPHIVTFMRTSVAAVDITFEVTDAANQIVVPSKKVSLAAESTLLTANSAECKCTGSNSFVDTDTYGLDYGKRCNNWDQTNCQTWYSPDVETGPWCCQKWCYVNKECPDAFVSSLAPNTYFSYDGACGGTSVTAANTCPWVASSPCACITATAANLLVANANPWTAANNATIGANYGSSCMTWDYDNCDVTYAATPWVLDNWCCQSWCWVDKDKCGSPTSIASEVWPGLYWATTTCEDDTVKVNSCPYKKMTTDPGAPTPNPAPTPACDCTGIVPPLILDNSGRRRAGNPPFPTDYGSSCDTWDKDNCDGYFPREDEHGIWCCQTWCYVDEACPTAQPSFVYPGFFWSSATSTCAQDVTVLQSCSFPKPASGKINPCDITKLANTDNSRLEDDELNVKFENQSYGKYCSAWDKDKCEQKRGDTTKASWWGTDNDRCCDSWIYIAKDCPISVQSEVDPDLYYSYELCPDSEPAKYDTVTKTCVASGGRRLKENNQAALRGGSKHQPTHETQYSSTAAAIDEDPRQRRLGARRRSGGSYSGARRRSSYSRPSPPRRRAPSPRRRAPAPTRRRLPPPPRRRMPQRRRSPPAPPPSPRRRQSASQGQTPSLPQSGSPRRRTERRRSTPVAGTGGPGATAPRRRTSGAASTPSTPSTPPRRRQQLAVHRRRNTLATTSPRRRANLADTRRRTAGYGYSNSQQLQNQYGGSMPAQTNYGYSGQGPKKNSKVPMMMAAGAGLVGGAALGVGSYYAYQQYTSGRRRSPTNPHGNWGSNNLQDQSWCTDSASGKMMKCYDCQQAYGSKACQKQDSCYQGNNCNYQIPQNTRLDQVMDTGFVPMEYTMPLRIRISKIAGNDYAKSKICPKTDDNNQPDDATFGSVWKQASSFDLSLFVTLTELSSFPSSASESLPPSTQNVAQTQAEDEGSGIGGLIFLCCLCCCCIGGIGLCVFMCMQMNKSRDAQVAPMAPSSSPAPVQAVHVQPQSATMYNGPLPQHVAPQFIQALRQEYCNGVPQAVGACIDQHPDSGGIMEQYEQQVQSAPDKEQAIQYIERQWGLR